jgi:hypothetical protein
MKGNFSKEGKVMRYIKSLFTSGSEILTGFLQQGCILKPLEKLQNWLSSYKMYSKRVYERNL